jgi:predicted nuclease of restriction endonuclease-like (RecB) superfamily
LAHHIDTQLFHRKGNAVTNFKTTLPALDSDLATDVLKDPYVFDFITTSNDNPYVGERHKKSSPFQGEG